MTPYRVTSLFACALMATADLAILLLPGHDFLTTVALCAVFVLTLLCACGWVAIIAIADAANATKERS